MLTVFWFMRFFLCLLFNFFLYSWSTEIVDCRFLLGGVAAQMSTIRQDIVWNRELILNLVWLKEMWSIKMWARWKKKARTHRLQIIAQARLPQGTTSARKLSVGKQLNPALTKQWLLLLEFSLLTLITF